MGDRVKNAPAGVKLTGRVGDGLPTMLEERSNESCEYRRILDWNASGWTDIQPDHGGMNAGGRPEGLWRHLADAPARRQEARDDADGAVCGGVGLGQETVGHFLLNSKAEPAERKVTGRMS